MVLTYADASPAPGKATPDSDVVEGRFVEIVPIRGRCNRWTRLRRPRLRGHHDHHLEVTAVAGGTRLDIRADDVPDGISADDHAAGLASSLTNLAAHLE